MKGKEETIKDYQERINKVLHYVNNNLDEKLDLKRLADISNFSTFHFHRIMRAHLNESLGAYIVRIRLDTAARLIKFTGEPLNEIAYKVGYDTPSSFSKAFKKRFNFSPLDFRNENHDLKLNGAYIDPENLKYTMKLKPKIVTLSGKQVVYIQTIGKYGDPATGEAWDKIWKFVKENKLFSWRMESIGICHDDPDITEPEKCRYDACITVKKEIKPEGEVGFKKIPGGKYAVFKFKGPYDQFNSVYKTIYREWLPGSGFELRNVPGFEKYLNNPNNTKPEKLLTEIYIPII